MKRSFNLCRSKQVQAVLLGALLVTVSACGQKGPLYLPEKPKAEKKQEDSSTSSERTKQDNKDKK